MGSGSMIALEGEDPRVTRDVAIRSAMLATQKAENVLDGMNVHDEDDNSLSKAIGYTQIADTYMDIARVLAPHNPYHAINVNNN